MEYLSQQEKEKLIIYHPLFFAAFPVLTLYNHNIDQTPFVSFLLPFIAILLLSAVFWFALNYFIKDWAKSSLLISVGLFFFFLYGHIHSLILGRIVKKSLYKADFKIINDIAKTDLSIHKPIFITFLVIITLLIFIILKRKQISASFTKYLNYTSLILVVFSLFNIIVYTAKSKRPEYQHAQDSLISQTNKNAIKRDIYYIILDGYARADILKEFYKYDNSQFINDLNKKGFYVASNSHCNYAWTFLSLPSSLNLKYINYLTNTMGTDSQDLKIPYEMIKNNKTVHFLKNRGYQFIHFNSTWGATLNNKYADRQISYNKGIFRDEFLRILAETTMFKIIDSYIIEDLAEFHLYTFKKLMSIPDIAEPTFTFAHIVLPHHPYIFDRNGNIIKHASMHNQFKSRMWKKKKKYVEQLIFVNKIITEVLDELLRKSDVPPIIILQSDHGPQVLDAGRDDYIRARMCNLNAYYLPEGGDKYLYNSITPVNTFRVVFNHYFGTQYELLEDLGYFSKMEKPYKLQKIEFSKQQ